jgi:hypothetical protein
VKKNVVVLTEAASDIERGIVFLASEGILPEVEVLALKRVVSLQLQRIPEQEHVTKTELASRMKTTRASFDRMLDPSPPPRARWPASEKRPPRLAGR